MLQEDEGNDALLTVRCWEAFDGLREWLGDKAVDDLLKFAARPGTTKPETYRRRRQETQRLREEKGALRPSREVVTYRRMMDGAGPPGSRR
jgi:hypothetical protein